MRLFGGCFLRAEGQLQVVVAALFQHQQVTIVLQQDVCRCVVSLRPQFCDVAATQGLAVVYLFAVLFKAMKARQLVDDVGRHLTQLLVAATDGGRHLGVFCARESVAFIVSAHILYQAVCADTVAWGG